MKYPTLYWTYLPYESLEETAVSYVALTLQKFGVNYSTLLCPELPCRSLEGTTLGCFRQRYHVEAPGFHTLKKPGSEQPESWRNLSYVALDRATLQKPEELFYIALDRATMEKPEGNYKTTM